jgi:hypothetical protein
VPDDVIHVAGDEVAQHRFVLLLHARAKLILEAGLLHDVGVRRLGGREDRAADEEVRHEDRVPRAGVLGLHVEDLVAITNVVVVAGYQARLP